MNPGSAWKKGKQLAAVKWLAQSCTVLRQNWDCDLGFLTLSYMPFLLPHSASQPFPAAMPSVVPVSLLPRFIPPAPLL